MRKHYAAHYVTQPSCWRMPAASCWTVAGGDLASDLSTMRAATTSSLCDHLFTLLAAVVQHGRRSLHSAGCGPAALPMHFPPRCGCRIALGCARAARRARGDEARGTWRDMTMQHALAHFTQADQLYALYASLRKVAS